MVNSRLRGAMRDAEMTPARLAEFADVDVKTVHRWLTEDRIPYPITRHRVAHALGHEETYLWPVLLVTDLDNDACVNDISGVWPTRTAIGSEAWHRLFDRATRQLDILIYAGSFLIETLDITEVLRFKAGRGTAIRVLLGDPDSAAVRARADELGLKWLPERCRTTASYLEQAVAGELCVRNHGTTLYASQFRFDDVLLINTHAHGVWSDHSPVLKLGRTDGPLFQFYSDAFERVWAASHSPSDVDPDGGDMKQTAVPHMGPPRARQRGGACGNQPIQSGEPDEHPPG
jgi:hypothetical protein